MTPNLNEELERYRKIYEQGLYEEAFILYADALRRAGKFTMALNICREGLKSHPASLRARLLLSQIFLDSGHYDKAQQEIEEVLKKNPSSTAALLTLARIMLRKKDFETAMNVINKLKKIIPSSPEINQLEQEIQQHLNSLSTAFILPENNKIARPASSGEYISSLASFLKQEKGVKDFFILQLTSADTSLPDNSPVNAVKALCENLQQSLLQTFDETLNYLYLEANNESIMIFRRKDLLLIVTLTPEARAGKIKVFINEILNSEGTEQ